MKRKYTTISISLILLIALIVNIINKNSQKYIMQEGVMLALTLDGEKTTSFPEGRNYKIEINCENGKGRWLVDEWKLSVEKITGNVICNVDFISRSNNDKLIDEVESKATTVSLTNNSGTTETSNRYTGKTPDNWIWFNNEMWRIIGSIPVCLNSSCSSKENLIKIIRSESIGGLAFDGVYSDYTTVWGNNTLYDLLNNYYYGEKDATGASPCYGHSTYYGVCNYTQNGISNSATDYYGKMIKSVYWNIGTAENGVSNPINNSYGLETATISTVSGKIGLMNASDYGYGSGQTTVALNSLSSYGGSNWLYSQGFEWTISPTNGYILMRVTSNGDITQTSANSGYAVRPVAYLDQSVYIISGDGTEENPYQIGM